MTPTIWAKLALDSAAYTKQLNAAASQTQGAGAKIGKALAGIGKVAIVALAAAGAATVALGVKSFLAAAAVDELVAVNEVLGKNAGLAETAVKAAAEEVKGMGIEAAVSQRIVAEFIKAELDLAQASDIARIAQDAAVISQTNSSEAAAALIQGIVKLDTEILRTQGLTIDAKKAYDAFAETLGKTATDLSAAEKQQAFMNAVMEEGGKIAGAYTAAMEEPGKVLRSFPRYFNDISVALGSTLKPIFTEAIFLMANWTKGLGKALQEGGALVPVLDAIKSAFEPLQETLFGDIKPLDFEAMAKKLMPFVEGLAKLIQIGANVIQFFKDNAKTIVDTLIPAMAALVIMWLATVIPAFLAALPAIGAVIIAAAPIILTFLAIMAVVALLRKAWETNFLGIRDAIENLVEGFTRWIGQVQNFLEALGIGGKKPKLGIIPVLEEVIDTTEEFSDATVQAMVDMRDETEKTTKMLGGLSTSMEAIQKGIDGKIGTAWETYRGLVKKAGESVREFEERQSEALEATDLLTKELIFQTAIKGLDEKATLALAREMGFLSEVDFVVTSATIALREEFDLMDGTLDGVIEDTEGYAQAVSNLSDAVLFLPHERDVVVTARFQSFGFKGSAAWAFLQAAGTNIKGLTNFEKFIVGNAGGGPVSAGVPSIVGERGAELFVPNVDGQIFNQNQLRGMGGGGDPALLAEMQGMRDDLRAMPRLVTTAAQSIAAKESAR